MYILGLVRWFIIVGASLSEQCIADLNVMAHKPWITAEFVTVCCFMSVVSNTVLLRLHTRFNYINFTLKIWAKFLALMSVDYAWTNSTIGVICTGCHVCEQPALVCHSSCHACVNVVFVLRASFGSQYFHVVWCPLTWCVWVEHALRMRSTCTTVEPYTLDGKVCMIDRNCLWSNG